MSELIHVPAWTRRLLGWLPRRYPAPGWPVFRVTPMTLPEETRALFKGEDLARLGILPLGTKREGTGRRLNLGFVDATRAELPPEIEAVARGAIARYRGFVPYRITREDFERVLAVSYQWVKSACTKFPSPSPAEQDVLPSPGLEGVP